MDSSWLFNRGIRSVYLGKICCRWVSKQLTHNLALKTVKKMNSGYHIIEPLDMHSQEIAFRICFFVV